MLSVSVEVDDDRVEGPDEGEVEGGVMWCSTLHPGTLAHTDVSVGWGQSDLRGIWGERHLLSSECRRTPLTSAEDHQSHACGSRGQQWDAYPSHHTQPTNTNSTRFQTQPTNTNSTRFQTVTFMWEKPSKKIWSRLPRLCSLGSTVWEQEKHLSNKST